VSNQKGKAVGGSFLGGVLGAILGIIVGVTISRLVGDDDKPTGTGLLDSFIDFIWAIISAILRPVIFGGIGGVIGAVGGSVLGAALATSSRDQQKEAPPHRQAPQVTGSPALAEESSETELARLKERMAELEEQKRKETAE
jgi:hypothetical protein